MFRSLLQRALLLLGRPLTIAIGIGFLILGVIGTSLGLAVHHEPAFYARNAVPPGKVRKQHSNEFMSEVAHLYNYIKFHEVRWFAKFTDAQINSYFEEAFIQSKTDRVFLPDGVSCPRISIEPDRIRLAFRYGAGTWSTIISIDLRAWLVKKLPNAVALELQGLHAGALPITAQSLLESITKSCQRKNIEIKWFRHKGNPVALLRFQTDSARPSVQLTRLELKQGMLVLGGRSSQPQAQPLLVNAQGAKP